MADGRDDRHDLDANGGVSRRGFLGSVVPAAVGVAVAKEALSAPAAAPAAAPELPAAEPRDRSFDFQRRDDRESGRAQTAQNALGGRRRPSRARHQGDPAQSLSDSPGA